MEKQEIETEEYEDQILHTNDCLFISSSVMSIKLLLIIS